MATPISELSQQSTPNADSSSLFDALLNEIESDNDSSLPASDALYARQMLDTSPNTQHQNNVSNINDSVDIEEINKINNDVNVDMQPSNLINTNNIDLHNKQDTTTQQTTYELNSLNFGNDLSIQIKYAITVGLIVLLFSMTPMNDLFKIIPSIGDQNNAIVSCCKALLASILFFGIDSFYRMQT